MKAFRTTLGISSVLLAGLAGLCAEPEVDPRFDNSVLSPDFEGQWAGLPAEAPEGSQVEVITFAQPETIEAAVPTEAPAARPLFVESTLFPSGRSVVFGVAETETSDVVLLDNGQDQGFRTGMICEVLNTEGKVGEIILVDVRADRAAALITQLENNQLIRFGDSVRIKPITYL